MPWFHGKIPRPDAEKLLERAAPGTYLVRESTNFPGDYTLCVKVASGCVDHFHITSVAGKITLDDGETTFSSLDDLIAHYSASENGLSQRLSQPLVRQGGDEFKVDQQAIKQWEIPFGMLHRGKKLGAGQFGDVFEGTYNGKRVAVKTLKNYDESAKQEFLAEASVMTQLKHKHLVELIGIVTSGPEVMLVTEFMSKGNLLDYLRSRGRSVIKPETLLRFTIHICRGMAYLEKQSIVHRDLAARNVLINDEDYAKVADFGLARRSISGDIDSTKLPIKWTAPEVLKLRVSTTKSDVWSFGVTMWEIFSYGRSPYPKMNQKEVVSAVEKGYRMERPDDCPDDLYHNVMRKCWEREALERPTFNRLKKLFNEYHNAKDIAGEDK
jgi:c-src tyrosine kinase